MRYGVFMEYMWDIRGVFTGYSYVSGMYRVCIGNVSEHTGSERGDNLVEKLSTE